MSIRLWNSIIGDWHQEIPANRFFAQTIEGDTKLYALISAEEITDLVNRLRECIEDD